MTQSWQEQFGRIRALVHQPGELGWGDEALSVLMFMHDTDPMRYCDEVLPYLEASLLPVHRPVLKFTYNGYSQSFDALSTVLEVAPFARLDLDVNTSAVMMLLKPAILSKVRRLAVHQRLNEDALYWLARGAEYFSDLESLSVKGSDVGEEVLRLFLTTPQLQSLKRLELTSSYLGSEWFGDVLALSTFGGLEHLDLSDSYLGGGFEAVFDSPLMNNLKTLNLTSTYFDEHVWLAPRSFQVNSLQSLSLSSNDISHTWFEQFCGIEMPRLEMLDLSGNDLNADSVGVLLESTSYPRLKTLNVQRTELYPEALMSFKGASNFPMLERVFAGDEYFWQYSEYAIRELGFVRPDVVSSDDDVWVLDCRSEREQSGELRDVENTQD